MCANLNQTLISRKMSEMLWEPYLAHHRYSAAQPTTRQIESYLSLAYSFHNPTHSLTHSLTDHTNNPPDQRLTFRYPQAQPRAFSGLESIGVELHVLPKQLLLVLLRDACSGVNNFNV